jgi:hypothetical protein
MSDLAPVGRPRALRSFVLVYNAIDLCARFLPLPAHREFFFRPTSSTHRRRWPCSTRPPCCTLTLSTALAGATPVCKGGDRPLPVAVDRGWAPRCAERFGAACGLPAGGPSCWLDRAGRL